MTENLNHSSKKKNTILKAVFFVCLAGFLICAGIIAYIQIERKLARNAYSDLRQEIQQVTVTSSDTSDTVAETSEPEETAAVEEEQPLKQVHTLDFDALHEMSENIVGWITAEGTNVDYPVVQGEDNDYYLDHMYNGQPNGSGAIFMDYRDTDPETSRNLVLYGHHMQDRSMFQSLSLYKNTGFYEDHPTMMYYAPEGDYIVELISGSVESADTDFLKFDFEDDAELQSYVDSFREHSTFQSDVELQPGDRIISLVTCSYEMDNARYMIIGRLVPVTE